MPVTTIKTVSPEALGELAAVLHLRKEDLQPVVGHGDDNKVRPSAAWLAEQQRLVAGLPKCFRRPDLPRGLLTRLTQVTKQAVTATSGGARHIAQKSSKGSKAGKPSTSSLDERLHPMSTPTVFCRAHRRMQPVLMRELFYYLTREVADHADAIRRHPRHDSSNNDARSSDTESDEELDPEHTLCRAKTVRNWGHRMLGLSALWCDAATFRSLELGLSSAQEEDGGGGGGHPRRRRGLHSADRMPQLEIPCEACVLAVIGGRRQALIDVRAGLLSRMGQAQAAADWRARRSDKKKKKKGKQAQTAQRTARRAHMPSLLKVVEAFVDGFDAATADAMRQSSEQLSYELFVVRACEARRRRRLDRQRRRQKSSGTSSSTNVTNKQHHHHHHRRRRDPSEPLRMVTQHGHRQPLPLLPDSLDPWTTTTTTTTTTGHTGSTETGQTPHHHRHHDRPRHHAHPHRTHRHRASRRGDEEEEDAQSTYADAQDGTYEGQQHDDSTPPLPPWEGDYMEAIYEYEQSTVAAAEDNNNARHSFLSATVPPTVVPLAPPLLRRRTSRLPVRRLSAALPETPGTTPEPERAASPAHLSRPISHIPVRLSRPISHIPLPLAQSTVSPSSTTRSRSASHRGLPASPPSCAPSTAPTTPPKTKPKKKQPRQQPREKTSPPIAYRAHSRSTSKKSTRPPPPPPPPPASSVYSAQAQHEPRKTAWFDLHRRHRSHHHRDHDHHNRRDSIGPDDSISCVLAAARDDARDKDGQTARGLHEQQQWRDRQERLRAELQRQQAERAQALAQLTGAATTTTTAAKARRRQSELPPYLSWMEEDAADIPPAPPSNVTAWPPPIPSPSLVPAPLALRPAAANTDDDTSMDNTMMHPPPLQLRRLGPLLPIPPHQQMQPVRLSPWTRLQTQMHGRPLPAQGSSRTTPWPGPYLY